MTDSSPITELNALLSESVDSAKKRESALFDELVGTQGSALVLFGAGNLGRKTLRGLRKAQLEPVAFADNNAAIWDTFVEGVPVLSPADAVAKHGKSAVFIMTVWRGEGTDTMAERCQPLRDLGCERVINFGAVFWKFPEFFLPHYSFDLPHKVLEHADEIRRAFALFKDDASQREFVAQIRWRLHLDFDGLPRPVAHEIYFPEDLVTVSNTELFVDCGAFDGDTMASFLDTRKESFSSYVAFEADPSNFEKLRTNIANLPAGLRQKLIIHPLAVGARREKVLFEATGTEASAVGRGTLEIQCVPLDQVLANIKPTWIKMDIEGSEPDALEGARQIISRGSPVLAVCVYHQQDHLWRIPLLIRELSSDYELFLRPHLLESWDLVCYAIPRHRLNRRGL